MKRVLFVNSTVYLPGEGGYKRTMYLLDMMIQRGYECTLITSDFNHYTKTTRDVLAFRQKYPSYCRSIQILHKIPYTGNITFGRLLSDVVYETKVAAWMKANCDKFDVIFVSDQEAVLRIAKIIKNKPIALIIDIRDLFPEAMRVVIRNNILYNLLTYPFKNRADRVYARADELVAVSREYLNRGLKTNTKSKHPQVVYIGATLSRFDSGVDEFIDTIEKLDDEFWLTYAGTLGASYDIKTVIMACKMLKDAGVNVVFKVLGHGPEEGGFKKYAAEIGASNIEFLGFMDYSKMAAYLHKSDAVVNCIKRGASQSIINKVADYFASGRPTLNSCRNEEMCWLIDHFKTGLNYEAQNPDDLIEKIMRLYKDVELRQEYGDNARHLALERFDRERSYSRIIEMIENTQVSGNGKERKQ